MWQLRFDQNKRFVSSIVFTSWRPLAIIRHTSVVILRNVSTDQAAVIFCSLRLLISVQGAVKRVVRNSARTNKPRGFFCRKLMLKFSNRWPLLDRPNVSMQTRSP